MTGFSRGSALTETALTLGILLILLLGTMQLGVLGFVQTAQDGAVFVAARTFAQSPASGVTRATGAANTAFGSVPTSAIGVAQAAGSVTATAATTGSAPSVPGAPASISLQSGATERIALPGAAGAFVVTGTLSNYRNASGTPLATHALGIAQPFLPSGNCDITGGNLGCDGSHVHVEYPGPTAEWDCRLAAYRALTFPSTRPKTGVGSGSNWDPNSNNSQFVYVYLWDNGTGCW